MKKISTAETREIGKVAGQGLTVGCWTFQGSLPLLWLREKSFS